MKKLPLVAMLINVMPQLSYKELPYEIVYGGKLKLPIDVALWPLQSTCTPAVGDYIQELQATW